MFLHQVKKKFYTFDAFLCKYQINEYFFGGSKLFFLVKKRIELFPYFIC